MTPGACTVKLFTVENNIIVQYDNELVCFIQFHPSQLFVGMASAYPNLASYVAAMDGLPSLSLQILD
jgi:hypothetical protein